MNELVSDFDCLRKGLKGRKPARFFIFKNQIMLDFIFSCVIIMIKIPSCIGYSQAQRLFLNSVFCQRCLCLMQQAIGRI